jgi:hypothetical protein
MVRVAPEVPEVLRRKHDDYYLPACARNKSDLSAWAQQTFAVESDTPSVLREE